MRLAIEGTMATRAYMERRRLSLREISRIERKSLTTRRILKMLSSENSSSETMEPNTIIKSTICGMFLK